MRFAFLGREPPCWAQQWEPPIGTTHAMSLHAGGTTQGTTGNQAREAVGTRGVVTEGNHPAQPGQPEGSESYVESPERQ